MALLGGRDSGRGASFAHVDMYAMWGQQMKHTDVDKAWWKAVRY